MGEKPTAADNQQGRLEIKMISREIIIEALDEEKQALEDKRKSIEASHLSFPWGHDMSQIRVEALDRFIRRLEQKSGISLSEVSLDNPVPPETTRETPH